MNIDEVSAPGQKHVEDKQRLLPDLNCIMLSSFLFIEW